jgi:zinc transport system ATP-binding protein
MSAEVVTVERLGCCYREGCVLEDVSFTVNAGDYVGIVGPNGSGKSTLVQALLGLVAISSGSASLFGSRCDGFSQWGRVGYLPQSLRLMNPGFPATVAETVGLGLLSLKKFPRRLTRPDRERVEEVLYELGICDIRSKLIGELSGGQQQRVLLARALVNNPELLILDEPTAALDPETRERFYQMISDINRTQGVTVLLVTHDTGVIGQHASKMLYLDKRMLFFGSFEDFCHSPEMSNLFGEHSQHLMCHRH